MQNYLRRLGLALAACAATLAGCATKPEPPRISSAPPALQAPVGASEGLAAQASAFESFMRHASRINAVFSGPSDVTQALQTGAAHEPHQLEAGMIAYAALAALEEPRFVAALHAEPAPGELARRLAADPQSALGLPGAEAAGARASGALYAQGAALSGEGEKVKHAAYGVQRQAWARAKAPDPAGRLSRVKHLSSAGYQPSREDSAELKMALVQSVHRPGPASAVVARAVALAALGALGEEARGQSLMREPRAEACLHMAKLNLYQCLASAGPHYEDIYCLGQHAMIDPGQCVVDATRSTEAGQIAMRQASYRR